MGILKNLILVSILGIFFIHLVGAAAEISISVDEAFHWGDEVKFAYRFVSSQNETIKYYANILCVDSPEALIEMKVTDLVANEYFQEVYVYGVVDKNMNSAECTASVFILEPYHKNFEKSFKIKNLESFSFNIELDKKIFTQNEEINIDYSSDVENPSLVSILTYPDKTTQQITLPTSIQADQIGTYILDVTASKEGYKTITKKEQFAVIESEAEISYLDVGQIPSGNYSKSSSKWIYLIVGLVVLILIVLVIVFILRGRRKKDELGNPIPKNIY